MGHIPLRALLALALATLAALTGGKARAAGVILPAGSGFEHVANGVRIVDGPGAGTFIGRTFANPAGGSMAVTESYGLRLGGSNLTVQAARALTLGELALATAALGGAAWAGFQIGSPIAKALGHDQFTIGPYRCTATYQGWKCDEGQPAIPGQGTVPGLLVKSGQCEGPYPGNSALWTCAWEAVYGTTAHGECRFDGETQAQILISCYFPQNSTWLQTPMSKIQGQVPAPD